MKTPIMDALLEELEYSTRSERLLIRLRQTLPPTQTLLPTRDDRPQPWSGAFSVEDLGRWLKWYTLVNEALSNWYYGPHREECRDLELRGEIAALLKSRC